MVSSIEIDETEAISIIHKEESHFLDFTQKEGDGRTIQKKATSFANSDGGEIFIGIVDEKERVENSLQGRWKGFENQEEANQLIFNILKNIKPQIPNINLEFLSIKKKSNLGKVLKVFIEKSPDVHLTSDGKVWVRQGAQCFEIFGQDISNLQLSKGATSYENQAVSNYSTEDLFSSEELKKFLQIYSPKTEAKIFLEKQKLIEKKNEEYIPHYAGILLYDDNPSASLPKKCAVKISRYNTNEIIPEREHLERQETVEGPLYRQIEQSLGIIRDMVESVSVMGPKGLEKADYPIEAIKEVVVNAIIHRDYNLSDDVLIFVYNNRIEVHSPGVLPANITPENILDQRFNRNSKIVRLLNKYPDPPNKDIGEGLNTAFQKMKERKLKDPIIKVNNNRVIVTLPHERLAKPEEQILEFLDNNDQITNPIARNLTGVKSENSVKTTFYKLRDSGLLERVPGMKGRNSAWRLKKID